MNETEKLLEAIGIGDKTKVESIIKKGYDVQFTDENGNTLLHYAAMGESIEIFSLLLSYGLNINAQNNWGLTPLMVHLTSCNLDFAMVQAIIESGTDPNIKDEDGCTALHVASTYCDAFIVHLLIDNNFDINAQNNDGKTPLMVCYDEDLFHNEVASILLKFGADTEIRDNTSYTALFYAVNGCNDDFIRLLYDNGADFNAKDSEGKTALIHLVDQNYTIQPYDDMVIRGGTNVHETCNKGWTALHYIFYHNSFYNIESLIKHGAMFKDNESDLDFILCFAIYTNDEQRVKNILSTHSTILQKGMGRVALALAIQCENRKIFECILEHNPSIDYCNEHYTSAFNVAAAKNDIDAMRLLLKKGANPNGDNASSSHPLKHVESVEAAKLLIESGSRCDIKPSNAWSVLEHILFFDKLDIFTYLLEVGFDVNGRHSDGKTLLMFCVSDAYNKQSGSRYIKALLGAGAHIDDTDCFGKTALMYAKDSSAIRMLLETGANPNIQDKEGATALYLASVENDLDKIKLLLLFKADPNIEDCKGLRPLDKIYTHGEKVLKLAGATHSEYFKQQQKENPESFKGDALDFIKELL